MRIKSPRLLLKYGMLSSIFVRNVSSFEITKNITLISNDEKKSEENNNPNPNAESRPTVIMLSWLMARKKHIYKYCEFYLNRNMDVINVSVSPWQVLWPLRGTQVVANDLVKYLDEHKSCDPLIVHGFSVGGYVWSEALVKMVTQKDRYQHIIDRIVGQVWDSLADVTEIPEGFPIAVFPKNPVLQNALRKYIVYHLKAFDKVATCHYVRASQMFHTNIIKVPALFFVSSKDTIGSVESNQRVREYWESMGIKTFWKVWEDSAHVGHFRKYPAEYKALLKSFLTHIGLERDDVKDNREEDESIRAKL